MTGFLVALLVILWAVVLVPVLLGARQNASISSIGTFSRSMRALSSNHIQPPNGAGRWVLTPRTLEDDAERRMRIPRRRRIFVCLLGVFGGSVVVGLLPPFRVMLWASLLLALALGGFVAFLIQDKNKNATPAHRRIGAVNEHPEQPREDEISTVFRLANTPPSPTRIGGRTVHRIVDESFEDDGLGELGFLSAGRY